MVNETQHTRLLWDVLGALNLPAFIVDKDVRITDINSVVSDRFSFTRDELINSSIFQVIDIGSSGIESHEKENITILEGRCFQKDRETFPAKITFLKYTDFSIVIVEDRSDVKKITTRATQRSREINTFNDLSKTLSRHIELKEITKGVLDTLVNGMRIDAAWLYLTDQDTGELSLWSFKGVDEKIFEEAKLLKPYQCFIGRVLSSEKSLLVRNASEDPRITHIKVIESGIKSIAGVPLTVKGIEDPKGKVVGVLGVASKIDDYFTSLDVQFLSTVGNHVGVAIENARLIANLKEKMRQIEMINEISSVINSSLSIGHIFRLVASEIKKTIDFDRASINLLDEDGKALKIFALDTTRSTKLTKGLNAPVEGTSSGWVALNQKPWINYDLKKETRFAYDSVLLKEGLRSTVSIPLFKDRPLGALNFDSTYPEKYSEKDLDMLLPIAKHLAIALENALLFEDISKEKREWEKTFDAITDMVWIEDLHRKVLRVNKAVLEKSGKPELTLIHKNSDEMFETLKITNQEQLPFELIERKRRLYQELKGLDGSTYHFWSYPLVDSEGKTYGVVNYLRDVSEQIRLEQQLMRTDKLASLGTLVAGIAHEINNPLGIIAGYSEALLDRSKEAKLLRMDEFEDFPEYLETINKEIFRCKNILQSLLDFVRPSTGTFREIDINELIKEVILLVDHKAKKHNHTLELNLERDIPKIIADPGALRQLFINIIMNSLYFMDLEGKININTKHETDPFGIDTVHISIADNGKGIKQDIIDKVFDPFVTTKPVGEGTGLGLAICHRIVAEHNGTIDVSNNRVGGTTFSITLPVKDSKA